MHPDPRFRWSDEAAMRAFVAERGFGVLFVATPEGPRALHLPVVWLDDATLGLHVARSNIAAKHLDGATALFVVQGPDAYISPDWYRLRDQVPTWNYLSVELEGRLHRMEQDALVAQLDQVSDEGEARLAPKPVWTRAKMDPAKFEAMTRALVGFSFAVTAWRGTRKLGQNKVEAVRLAAADGAEAAGHGEIADLMRGA